LISFVTPFNGLKKRLTPQINNSIPKVTINISCQFDSSTFQITKIKIIPQT